MTPHTPALHPVVEREDKQNTETNQNHERH